MYLCILWKLFKFTVQSKQQEIHFLQNMGIKEFLNYIVKPFNLLNLLNKKYT